MNTKIWPFLVSANETVDYRTVAAPDFMVESGMSTLLAGAAGGKSTGPGEAHVCEMTGHPTHGKLTLVYQIVPAVDNGKQLTDHIGRPIRRIEGVVLEGHHPNLSVSLDSLAKARESLDEHFKTFWPNNSRVIKSISTSSMEMDVAAGSLLSLNQMKSYDASPRNLGAKVVAEPAPPPEKKGANQTHGASRNRSGNSLNAFAQLAKDHPIFMGGAGAILTCLGTVIALDDINKSRRDHTEPNWVKRVAGAGIGLTGVTLAGAAIYHGGRR